MFNPDKCELIRITNTKLPILYDYIILKKKIKVASSVKYLGVYTDEHLTWKEHVKHTISKANTLRTLICFKEILPLAPEQTKMLAIR